ncbi:hypothetical protein [Fibrobacter sp. UWB12]|uniref:hypothetical protein n=1 Tax=Fibrobacter sp. UWB12 TaxID=1896203 RepID=UPI000916F30E|nr:hypothetical protein [Fibrobacter sp. UWB12]SHL04958.1 hypothetical protein SAMN05720759_1172 [Fibrobacter sp. UWB12]
MKIIFIALSIIFFSACSNVEVSGYTESIVKNAKNSVSSSSSEKESKSEETKISALEEDLSSLDEESLREKLLNYYPWPKPKAEALYKTASGSDEEDISIPYEDTDELKHEAYDSSNDKIRPYSWEETRVSFNEVENYEYGFDRDKKDPIVYISVYQKDPKQKMPDSKAAFIPVFNTASFHAFILRRENSNMEDIKDEQGLKSNEKKELDYTGRYILYGQNKRKKWERLENQIVVIPYDRVTKNIILMEINGENKIQETDKEKNYFITSKNVKTEFDKIFNQALVNANVNEANIKNIDEIKNKYKNIFDKPTISRNGENITIEQLGKEHIVDVNMNNPNNKFIIQQTYRIAEKIKPNQKNKESPLWHVIYAINKERKYWDLEKCESGLTYCNNFYPQLEPKDAKYKLVTLSTKKCKEFKEKNDIDWTDVKSEDVEIRVSKEDNRYYYIYKNKKEVTDFECKILYTDDGYPILPSPLGVKGGTYAGVMPLGDFKSLLKDPEAIKYGYDFSKVQLDIFENYLPYGSIIFVPRGKTNEDGAKFPIYHELGHSFGLTDVEHSHFFRKYRLNEVIGKYASSETNLMSWTAPIGKKIKYRNIPIACTRGTEYYIFGTDEFIGSVERLVNKGRERQWDCIRGNCYNSSFNDKYPDQYYYPEYDDKKEKFFNNEKYNLELSYSIDMTGFDLEEFYLYKFKGYSNEARKDYWNHEGECDNNSKKIIIPKSEENTTYKQAYEKSIEGKYISIY